MKNTKPLGRPAYGSIGHLPSSRLGPTDSSITEGQARICCERVRDYHDVVVVTEKLDGSNVAIARCNGVLLALTRSGYEAHTSPYPQHHKFADWAESECERGRFDFLNDGEQVSAEWMYQAHGTRYVLKHPPFVAFDFFAAGRVRATYQQFHDTMTAAGVTTANLISYGGAMAVSDVEKRLGKYGAHGAIDLAEGAVWRVERNGQVDFLAKYVRQGKIDGQYLESQTGEGAVINSCAPNASVFD